MKITAATKVEELLRAHPYLEEFLAGLNPKFEMLRNKAARATIGRLANLRAAATIGGMEVEALLQAVAGEIERRTSAPVEVEAPGAALTREERLTELKAIIGHLHDGGDLETAQERFNQAVGDVDPCEIASMEEELVSGGLPVSEIQRLCDVHVGAFKSALDGHAPISPPPGHPLHTHMAENRVITSLADSLGAVASALTDGADADESLSRASELLVELKGIDSHYQRKENQLFPFLEKHGITGPPQVMWGVQDEIRAKLKALRATVESRDIATFAEQAPALARDLVEMVYKEEKILFPLMLETLSEDEWRAVRHGEDILGYAFALPAAEWESTPQSGSAQKSAVSGLLEVLTGQLSLEQLNLILTNLPVDLSFVDEHDTVRFYSEGPERIFPRSPAVIGRKVQNCHPPKSMGAVQELLDAFRAGTRDMDEFWIQLGGKFIHIRYFALRDAEGAYRGCLEVSQDATAIRQLEGEKRL